MFGNIMNNKQVAAAEEIGLIKISSFSAEKLKKIHYPLTAAKIFHRSPEMPNGNYDLNPVADLTNIKTPTYDIAPDEYMIVEIRELITMKDHFVGHFLPSSIMVDKGLSLTAGRIEAPFGDYNGDVQRVRFGIKNLANLKTIIRSTDVIAYVYFVDIRGLDNAEIELNPKERERFAAWTKRLMKAKDDGPEYN